MSPRKPGRPAKPVEMPAIPQQERPSAEGLIWYLTYAEHTHIRRVDGMMDLVNRLQGQSYAAWCPLGIKSRTHARQTVMRLEPLYAPVLFVGLRVDQGIAAMVQTIGIMDVVRSDSRKPLTISATELGRLWDVLQQDGGAKMLSPVGRGPWFKKDDPVRLKDGLWAGRQGIFSWCRGDRVKILLDTVDGVIHVETTLDKLDRA